MRCGSNRGKVPKPAHYHFWLLLWSVSACNVWWPTLIILYWPLGPQTICPYKLNVSTFPQLIPFALKKKTNPKIPYVPSPSPLSSCSSSQSFQRTHFHRLVFNCSASFHFNTSFKCETDSRILLSLKIFCTSVIIFLSFTTNPNLLNTLLPYTVLFLILLSSDSSLHNTVPRYLNSLISCNTSQFNFLHTS